MTDRNTPAADTPSQQLADLESSLSRFAPRGPAPVHLWEPEHCGDIGLSIGADGTWFYRGSPITRKALVRLFSTILRKDADGCHYLVTPVEKIVVDVADAPFLAVEMTAEGEGEDQTLVFRTNVDDEARAGPDNPLRFAREPENAGVKPYVLVRGALEALATRAVTYELIERGVSAVVDGVEQFGVWSGGRFFAIAPANEAIPS